MWDRQEERKRGGKSRFENPGDRVRCRGPQPQERGGVGQREQEATDEQGSAEGLGGSVWQRERREKEEGPRDDSWGSWLRRITMHVFPLRKTLGVLSLCQALC